MSVGGSVRRSLTLWRARGAGKALCQGHARSNSINMTAALGLKLFEEMRRFIDKNVRHVWSSEELGLKVFEEMRHLNIYALCGQVGLDSKSFEEMQHFIDTYVCRVRGQAELSLKLFEEM
ncbi:hypothetical protein MUK42_10047 [Musa troglodytarum]|uniref:Uncharacterized protein n=1 Tax=Musa troglodytarum TaxID=320322 RepID=A0A9E7EI57_9LILI|nr:hypothetical protein MUK42_10047 [Musa troglodytarum]